MRKFLKRADRLFDYVVGLDALLINKKFRPANLKDIIDNLRSYTVLGFLWIGAKALIREQGTATSYAAFVFFLVIFVLLFLVAAQTSLIILMSVVGWGTMLLPPRVAVRARMHLRKDIWYMKMALLVLMFPVLFSAWMVAAGLIDALARSGVL